MFCSQCDTNLAPIPWTKYFEESFGTFFTLHLLSNISTQFSTFCLFVFSLITFILQVSNHWFNFWFEVFFFVYVLQSSFSLEILVFSWVLEFLEKVLTFSLKLNLVFSQQSLVEEWLFFCVFNKKQILSWKCDIFFICRVFR